MMPRFREDYFPRLVEKYTETEFKALVSDYLDDTTAAAVYFHFALRRVNETETINNIDVWELHFKNVLRLIEKQYENYLRIDNTVIDPLVTDYIERQIRTKNAGTTSEQISRNTEEETTSEGTTGTTTTPRTTKTTTRSISGTENSTENITQEQELDSTTTETRNTTDTTAGSTTDTSSVKTDTREMQRNLPDSTYYTNATTTPARASGIPAFLYWGQASTQGERDSQESTTADSTSNTTATGTGTITTATTGSPSISTVNGYAGSSSGNENVTEQTGGSDTAETITTGGGSRTGTTTGTTTGETTAAGQTREQYTGRHGQAPQDLLDRARLYILRTNAFEWLTEKLNNSFLWEV